MAEASSPIDVPAEASFATLDDVRTTEPIPQDEPWIHRIMALVQRRRNRPRGHDRHQLLPVYDPAKPGKSDAGIKNIPYLAYASNLCAATFKGRRGIQPLSAVNVIVPDLEVVFDLPGLPYNEPCFANTRFRSMDSMPGELKTSIGPTEKDALLPASVVNETQRTATALGWTKGLVGVVYEVTPEDFAHIVATEGGGTSYADIEIPCFPVAKEDADAPVPLHPKGKSFKAHTLFAKGSNGISQRRDGWAQPSKRYLGLLSTGAKEHKLPLEYRNWIESLQPYTITSWRQNVGRTLSMATWFPLLMILFTFERLTHGKDGKAPAWVARLVKLCFSAMWVSYDWVFKPIWGDGERTVDG